MAPGLTNTCDGWNSIPRCSPGEFGDGLAQRRQSGGRVVARLSGAQRLDSAVENFLRSQEVRLSDFQVQDMAAFRLERLGLRQNVISAFGSQVKDTLRQARPGSADRQVHPSLLIHRRRLDAAGLWPDSAGVCPPDVAAGRPPSAASADVSSADATPPRSAAPGAPRRRADYFPACDSGGPRYAGSVMRRPTPRQLQQPGLHRLRQRWRPAHVEPQAHRRGDLVDVLAARPGGRGTPRTRPRRGAGGFVWSWKPTPQSGASSTCVQRPGSVWAHFASSPSPFPLPRRAPVK